MGLKDIYKDLIEYFETDEITDMVVKRDYYNTTALSCIYPVMKENYRLLSVLLIMIHYAVNLFHVIAIFVTFPVYLKYNFTLMTYTIQVYFLIQICMLFCLSFNLKRKQFRTLHSEMVGTDYNYGEKVMDILDVLKDEMWKERRFILALPIVLVIVGSNVIFMAPLVDRSYGTLGFNVTEFKIYMGVPIPGVYPISTDGPYAFYILSFLQFVTAVSIVSTIGSAALVFVSMFQNFGLQLKFLLAAINNIEARAEEEFFKRYGNILSTRKVDYDDRRFQECYAGCLKKCVNHHQLILRWFDSLQDLLSIPLGVAYAIGTVIIALSLLSVKTGTSLPGTAITSFMMCILEVCFMALISVLGQRIADLSEDLRMAMYNVKWYLCTESTKLSMQIFYEMSFRTMQLTGFGLVKANLDTFSNVMNSAYSYYNLIMAV